MSSQLCDHIVFNLKEGQAQEGSRAALRPRIRKALEAGRFVHWIDPCVLPAGHKGDHVLTTQPRP